MEALPLLPHEPPMLFVDSLVERSGDKAVGMAKMPVSGICFDETDPFSEFLEIVAQTVAMANGYDALCCGEKMSRGMLVGIDSFSIISKPRPGQSLQIEIEKTFEFGAVKIIHGEVACEGLLVAQGDIKVWEDPGE